MFYAFYARAQGKKVFLEKAIKKPTLQQKNSGKAPEEKILEKTLRGCEKNGWRTNALPLTHLS